MNFWKRSVKLSREEKILSKSWDSDPTKIVELLSPCIAVNLKPVSKAGSMRPGMSRFGGVPDLPADASWPVVDGVSGSFLCQINLAELPDVDDQLNMLRHGWLCLFTSLHTDIDEHWCIGIHCSGKEDQYRPMPPAEHSARLPGLAELAMSFCKDWSMPPYESNRVKSLALSDADQSQFIELPFGAVPQILGEPLSWQGGVKHHWVSAVKKQPRDKAAVREADFEMLLQFEFYSALNLEEHLSDGKAFIGISNADLAAGRFDRMFLTIEYD